MIKNANMELYTKLLYEYGNFQKEEQKPDEKNRCK